MMMKCAPRLPSVDARLAQHFSLHNDWGDKARCLLCPPNIYRKEGTSSIYTHMIEPAKS